MAFGPVESGDLPLCRREVDELPHFPWMTFWECGMRQNLAKSHIFNEIRTCVNKQDLLTKARHLIRAQICQEFLYHYITLVIQTCIGGKKDSFATLVEQAVTAPV